MPIPNWLPCTGRSKTPKRGVYDQGGSLGFHMRTKRGKKKELAPALSLSFSGSGVPDLLGRTMGLLGDVDGLGSTLC